MFQPNGLAWLLQIFFFISLVAPMVFFGLFSYLKFGSDLTDLSLANRGSLTHAAALAVKKDFDALSALAGSLAGRAEARTLAARGSWSNLAQSFQYVLDGHPLIDSILIADSTGTITASLPAGKEVDKNLSARDWYQGVIAGQGKPYLSEIYKAADSEQAMIAVAAPIIRSASRDASQLISGIVVMRVKADELFRWMKDLTFGTAGFIYLVDHKGHLAAHAAYPGNKDIVSFIAVLPAQNAALGRSGTMVFTDPIDRIEKISAYEAVPGYGWGVIAEEPAGLAFADRDRALVFFVLVYAFAFLINMVLAFYTVRIISNLRHSEKRLTELNSELAEASRNLEIKVGERTRRLEEALSREEAFLASIGEGMIVVNRDRKVLAINDVAQRLIGWTDLSVIGRDIADLLPMEDEGGNAVPLGKRPVTQAIMTGKKISATAVYTRKDRTKFPTLITVAPLILNGRIEGALEILHDITREKEIDRAKSEFISIASHQLNTPLGIIKWSIDAIKQSGRYEGLSPEIKESLDDIERNNARTIDLVQSLLSISRIEQNKVDSLLVSFNPTPAIKDVITEMSPDADKNGIKLSFKSSPSIGEILTDPPKFHEVIENLVSNAVKYSRPGGEVVVSLTDSEEGLMISVSDQGIGIPENARNRMFTKFFRAPNAALSDTKGSGLGLYVVKSYLDKWGWKIWYESEENRGTVFHILVPMKIAESAGSQAPIPKAAGSPAKRILIIEDEKIYSKVLKNRLWKEGYEVALASTADEGIRSARENRPDLILLDLLMPLKDGFTALRDIKSDPQLKDIRVIVLSNLSQEEDVRRAKELGAEDFIVKSHTGLGEIAQKIITFFNNGGK